MGEITISETQSLVCDFRVIICDLRLRIPIFQIITDENHIGILLIEIIPKLWEIISRDREFSFDSLVELLKMLTMVMVDEC